VVPIFAKWQPKSCGRKRHKTSHKDSHQQQKQTSQTTSAHKKATAEVPKSQTQQHYTTTTTTNHSKMVSALTGRLLANYNSGYASSNSSSSGSSSSGGEGAAQQQQQQQEQSRPRQQTVSPPSCYSIDRSTTSTNKRSSSNASSGSSGNSSSSSKRQKKECAERAYAASTAFACLKKAGRKIPAIRTSCPRGLPPLSAGVIHQGNAVTLVHSKDYIATTPQVLLPSLMLSSSSSSCWNDVELCAALIQATSSFYQIPAESSLSCLQKASSCNKNSDCEESNNETVTSSVTDETSSNGSSGENDVEAENKIISMGEALQITKHARLVTLASAPFNVVHVNAAYLSLTGLPSNAVLGRPFQDVLAAASGDDDFELTQLHGASLRAKSVGGGAQEQSNCHAVQICVTKIGAQPSKVSHFAVELHPSSANAADAAVDSSLDAPIRRDAAVSMTTAASSFGMVVA
jgi:hypothetical protein